MSTEMAQFEAEQREWERQQSLAIIKEQEERYHLWKEEQQVTRYSDLIDRDHEYFMELSGGYND